MGLHEVSFGGVLLSPLLGYALLALLLTNLIQRVFRRMQWTKLVWHHALFDTALFVCLFAGVTMAFTCWL